jgi:CRP-like cAMP-binding protein
VPDWLTADMDWPLLASLDAPARDALLASTRLRSFAKGETVVHEDDPSDSLHLVESGRLAVRVSTAEGDTAILNVLGPGDYFGELSLVGARAPVRSASVIALEEARTRSLSATAFRTLCAANRSAEQLLLGLLARRVNELSARLVEAMYAGMDVRVRRRLAELAETYAAGPSGPVVIPLTQDHLAGLVGGTRPSVNQVLQRLVALGVVELGRGRITVIDRDLLAR